MLEPKMKEIVANLNNTYTVSMVDGWSVTANATQLEEAFNTCFKVSLLPFFKKLDNG